ncbi:tRNA lysidine(34) synthetase TilS [Vespertiliibacter pulmonis]|uniref:tRNA(Ile)-lysidine synthase n=1 Tax=Vespertiliibacter pulmonis TaxID=1443036 RepID=A0A3N4VUG0_9PAST|nr:tRNA lysidine(34) synthetase TilS [Vespertiliibacter pulmonis]QLB20665.1 tRNA lysidine(34) synthetase TilS [Vespertiliibacter pulmonis]RPE82801.1 tRNA(Ile)-lysidine synthase [Vespertiliibacter pulmonis]
MLSYFRQQLHLHFPTQTDFLIGLSGGVDSIVLLTLFAKLRQEIPLNLRAVHIHHGLSPNANDWVAFCQSQCAKLHIPLTIRYVTVEGKQGLEANARTARYNAIQTIIQPNEIFTTAHHLDDQVETFFLALKRGSGVKGISAMQAVSLWQNFTIFRPLLSSSKAEILAYAYQTNLCWIEDESNQNIDFDRNFLRQQVLPTLNQRWNHFNQMVARTSQHCADQQQLITELLNEELQQRIDPTNIQRLNITGFNTFSHLKQRQLIRLWLEKNQQLMPSQIQLEEIVNTMLKSNLDKNPEIILNNKVIRRYQQHLFITEKFPKIIERIEINLNIKETISLPHNLGNIKREFTELIYTISSQSYRFMLPIELKDKLITLKLQPTGKVNYYKKLHREEMKKIWQKNSVPVWKRPRTPVIFYKDQFVMVLNAFHKISK